MSFKMKNFKIGANENGFHFQDSKTGVMFTLRKADNGRLDMAICSASADKESCESLKTMISGILEKNGLERCEFGDIAPEECFISENQDAFVLMDFAGDGICILHKLTNKLIGLMEVIDGVPVVGFDLSSHYDYENAVKDFFELCSDDIQKVKAGTYHGKTFVQRTDTVKQIRQELLRCLVEGIRDTCLSKEPEYEFKDKRIIIKLDEFSKIKMKDFGNMWMVDQSESEHPIRGFVYTIETLKLFPQINIVSYRYTFENKQYEVLITPKEVNKVLKEAVKRRLIDLTV